MFSKLLSTEVRCKLDSGDSASHGAELDPGEGIRGKDNKYRNSKMTVITELLGSSICVNNSCIHAQSFCC
jgi:hypothetical protein